MGKAKSAKGDAKKLAKQRAQEAALALQQTLRAAYAAGDPFVDAVKPFAAFDRNGVTGAWSRGQGVRRSKRGFGREDSVGLWTLCAFPLRRIAIGAPRWRFGRPCVNVSPPP